MNKTAIKNFAVWARRKLIADITYRASMLGITETGIARPLKQSTSDLQFFDIGTRDYATLSGKGLLQRDALVAAINAKTATTDYASAFRFIVEQVAYTWFNRMVAIRFMEVNGYLPSRIRVLSSEMPSKAEPDFVTTPFEPDLPFTDAERGLVMKLKDENRLDELFRMLFIKQCNKLNEILPDLFEKTEDYTELLLTISFTDSDGVVWHLIRDIPEDDFNVEKEGQVEIIGWMYQYYNTEPKDQVFANLKKNIKIGRDDIPAATQLFTPDWIVRYMVENSLGRLWVEGHPDEGIKRNWKYYLEEAEQEPDVQAQLARIREEYKTIKPEDLRCIDPCMGSGHILCYLFDVLMQIYQSQGWMPREAAQAICENNLYGLDIDDRAAQLAYFAVMMKGRQYDRRFLTRGIRPRVYAIQESNAIDRAHLQLLGGGLSTLERNNALNQIQGLMDVLFDAKEYGSILNVKVLDWALLRRFVEHSMDEAQISMVSMGLEGTQAKLQQLIDIGEAMAQNYDSVCTNPPYMGSGGMNLVLSNYVKEQYPIAKGDMSTVFMMRTQSFAKKYGYISMINIPVWMFLSTYDSLRNALLRTITVQNLVHFGRGVFGSDFGTVAFTFRNRRDSHYKGYYLKLFRKQSLVDSIEQKEEWFFEKRGSCAVKQEEFDFIPGKTFAYWISSNMRNRFKEKLLSQVADIRSGISTGDNDRFYRLWFEVSNGKISYNPNNTPANSNEKWFPILRAGEYKKWWGNRENIINLQNNANELSNAGNNFRLRTPEYYNKFGITWCRITIGDVSFRVKDETVNFGENSPSMFFKERDTALFFLGYLNTKLVSEFLSVINPTMTYQVVDIASLPALGVKMDKTPVTQIVESCISLAQDDCNDYETSWDFQHHPMVHHSFACMEDAFAYWQRECNERFQQLKTNEESLNRIFIGIYGLQDELTPEVEDKNITVRRADLGRDIRSLLSYAVGCMFGRYSLDRPGLAYAGGDWDAGKYSSFIPDADNCIPITDEAYFEDDIVGRFCEWLKGAFGAETMEENLDFIARALGNPGITSRDVIRNYFIKDFYTDHVKIYQKRPIYWLFDSGKQSGFKALAYMHRWNADTVGNLRVEYLHRMQRVYEREIEHMQDTVDNSRNPREVAAASKRREKLVKQLKEARDYDAKIAHVALSRVTIDLDDGVKVNYEKVQSGPDGRSLDILAKI